MITEGLPSRHDPTAEEHPSGKRPPALLGKILGFSDGVLHVRLHRP